MQTDRISNMSSSTVPQRVLDRLTSRIEVTDTGCWRYTGPVHYPGYGRLGWSTGGRGRTSRSVHRIMYEYQNGPIKDGLVLDHLCHDPKVCKPEREEDCLHRRCCNPDHLEAVTMRENILRGACPSASAARVSQCPQGHDYDELNTYMYRGARYCKTCMYERNRAARLKRQRASEPI